MILSYYSHLTNYMFKNMSYSENDNFHIEISDKFCKLMIEKNEDWRNHQVNNIFSWI